MTEQLTISLSNRRKESREAGPWRCISLYFAQAKINGEKVYSKIEPQHFATVLQGMKMVVTAGTGRGAQIPGIEVAGKTGTAQNPHGADHSVFALIAPANDPKIVIFCLVENGGFGASVACPIASLLAEFYLNRKVERTDLERRMKELSFR